MEYLSRSDNVQITKSPKPHHQEQNLSRTINFRQNSKAIDQWTTHGRRRRGRPQQAWKNQVTDFIRSRNLEEDMTDDRHRFRLGVALGYIDPNNKKIIHFIYY